MCFLTVLIFIRKRHTFKLCKKFAILTKLSDIANKRVANIQHKGQVIDFIDLLLCHTIYRSPTLFVAFIFMYQNSLKHLKGILINWKKHIVQFLITSCFILLKI